MGEPQTALSALQVLVEAANREAGVHAWVCCERNEFGVAMAERVVALPGGKGFARHSASAWEGGRPPGWFWIDPLPETTARELLRLAGKLPGEPNTCSWTEAAIGSDVYETSCGHSFCFNEGGPGANGMRWCPFCGKRIWGRANGAPPSPQEPRPEVERIKAEMERARTDRDSADTRDRYDDFFFADGEACALRWVLREIFGEKAP